MHAELREFQQTSRSAGFQANNTEVIQRETAEVIANLANATLADRDTMKAMQLTISTLTVQLAEANKKVIDIFNSMANLQFQLNALYSNTNRGGARRGPTRNGGSTNTLTFTHYCWTHGPKCGYTSADCTRRVDGHKADATKGNMKGGRAAKWKRYGA